MANHRKKYGWAMTKRYPHKGHPAYYERFDNNNKDILYWVFTHSKKVTFDDGTEIDTIDLEGNINPKEPMYKDDGERNNSRIIPRTYKGTRDALGKEVKDTFQMKGDIFKRFTTLITDFLLEVVPFTSNSKNKIKQNKKVDASSDNRKVEGTTKPKKLGSQTSTNRLYQNKKQKVKKKR